MKPTTPYSADERPESKWRCHMEQPDVIELIAAIDEERAPREPEPAPPPEPATPLAEVLDRAEDEPNGLKARIQTLSQEERLRALRGLLHEIRRWYYLVETKVRVGRRKLTTVEIALGNPKSNFRQDPKLARRVVDAALAIIQVAHVDIHKVHDPHPPQGNWGAVFTDVDALLRAQNLIPISEHERAARSRIRARNAETKTFHDECDGIMRAFLDGDIDLENDANSSDGCDAK